MANAPRAFEMPPHEPPPSTSVLNGGLYTGQPFAPDAPWRNFPAVPDTSFLTHRNLRSACPPPGATQQYPGGGYRPGNNFSPQWGVAPYSDDLDAKCTMFSSTTRPPPRFGGHYHFVDHPLDACRDESA